MPADILKKIVTYKKEELEYLRRQVTKQDQKSKANDMAPAQEFLKNFRRNDINIIAEVKKASPSAGVIRSDFEPLNIAHIYEENGAKCLSILTDEKFFQGHLDYLIQIKKKIKLPLLRKDFTLDEYHIYEGRAAGADSMLLIAAILDDYQLRDFHDLILSLGMMPLVEVHDADELNRAKKLDLKLLGINNRNLNTFETKIETSLELLKNEDFSFPVISESGLKDKETLIKLKEGGVSGFLIGESLMREKDFGKKLRELIL